MSDHGARRILSALVGVLVVGATIADFLTAATFNPATLHAAAVAAAGLAGRRRWLWPLAGLLVALGYVGLLWGPAPLEPQPGQYLLWVNRTLSAMSTLIVAALVDRWLADRDALARSRAVLEQHAADLETGNAELAAREEEIARQNEELQSQSEELERQSEELRIANDELATRERMLAQLLDLSRTLATEVHRAEVMSTICEALTDILSETAAASTILLRDGDRLSVRCYHGFGSDGPASFELRYEQAFASLVIGRGQTAFLQDLDLRPDLRVPQPRDGGPFRSVLSAPIWLRGQPVGTLEVYSREPQQWTEEQIGLITSIAAQASISLETARLFEELDRERRRFETVFRALPVGVLVCGDPECREVFGNPAAAALFNTPVDVNFSPFAPAPVRVRHTMFREGRALDAEALPLVRAVKHGEEFQAEELDLALPGGRRFTVLASAVPIYDADGKAAGGVCVFGDITARKQLEREIELRRREAEEASVRKTRFLAAVSHDIRTPANAIRLRAELIKRTATTPGLAGRIPELAEDLQASAVSLVDLVGEVLELTRFDTGKVELQESEFSLGEMLAEECAHLRPVAEAKGLALVCPVVDPPLWLRTDRIKLARVLGNLIDNSVKFTAAGEVRASGRLLPDRRVEIAIDDTGPGIPPEHRERIFDEFFQLRNPERDRAKGRGLGLAISKRLVDAMGGEIVAESPPGGGRFVVRLPADCMLPHPATLRPRAAAPPAGAGASLSGVPVLVVEDHKSTREDVVALLRAEGAVVSEAPDGRSALRVAREAKPRFILLDLMLPDIDGAEVLKAIRAERPATLQSIVVLSGDTASRTPDDLGRLGADAVITKPIDPAALIARLRGLVGG